ncbi:MAG: EAL domain-containing protein [Gammaproteobacteria bacterium]
MQDVFIGRQPIYNHRLEVVAYELLFRSGDANHAAILDGDRATSQVILNTFTQFGLEQIVGEHLAFINLTRGFLLGTYPLPVLKDRVVLEVLEDIEVDDEVIRAVRHLAERGFTIALDDFIYHRDLQPLVDVAKYIKMDILAMDRGTVRDHVTLLKQHDVKLLAEKVESAEDFEFCRELGFDYFQGYFFCRPNVIRGQRAPIERSATLDLLARLQDPTTAPTELEALIVRDVALSYHLLRYVNAAHGGLDQTVDSIHRALNELGVQRVRTLATLIALARIEDKPQALLITALVRARMCEHLARRLEPQLSERDSDAYFSVGVLSVLDAMLDMTMDEVLAAVPLQADLRQALLSYAGPLGPILHCVVAYDVGDWSEVPCPLDVATVRQTYLAAVTWAEDAGRALTD